MILHIVLLTRIDNDSLHAVAQNIIAHALKWTSYYQYDVVKAAGFLLMEGAGCQICQV